MLSRAARERRADIPVDVPGGVRLRGINAVQHLGEGQARSSRVIPAHGRRHAADDVGDLGINNTLQYYVG